MATIPANGGKDEAIVLGGGHVDILMNNAGISPFGPTAEHTEVGSAHSYSGRLLHG